MQNKPIVQNKPKIFIPDEDFYTTNVTFTSVNAIKDLVKNLDIIGINYFTFDRTYTDGSHIRLTSAGEWIEHYYRKKLYNVAIFERHPSTFSNGLVFWSWLNRAPIYSEASLFDIDHGLTITQPHKTYCDFYHFGTSCDNPIAEAVLSSKVDCLHRFIALFKQKAVDLIKKAESTRFILPTKYNTEFKLKNIATNNDVDIFSQGEIKRFYLGDEYDNNYLTGKETEILIHLHMGKKLVDISKSLYISDKTVGTHIDNIKNKLKCRTMFELGARSSNFGLQNIMPILKNN